MQRMPDLDYESLSQKVIVIFYTIDLSVTAYFSIVLLICSAGERLHIRKIYLIRFALIMEFIAAIAGAQSECQRQDEPGGMMKAGVHWVRLPSMCGPMCGMECAIVPTDE